MDGRSSRRDKRNRGIENMRIEKIVGSGTFGVVYKAVDKTDPYLSEVALKRIKMERETQGFPVTAIREIKLLTLMRNHPNIVHLREIVTFDEANKAKEATLADKDFENGDVFMVFEFVDYDLSGLLKAGSMPLTDQHIRCYLHQLLLGVACLHENDILHRDIKSANLLVTKANVLKIADWGLARSVPHDSSASWKLTNPVVTLWYRSPEVIVGSKKYDQGVDVWSVG
jgi:cyclin-dependent kinase 12/13